MLSRKNKFLNTLFILIFLSSIVSAQANLSFVRVSPQVKLVHDIGFATVEVNYSSPGAKGREIWGTLVPYGLAPNAFGNGKPMPWRVGANENTTITLSHDSKINGSELKSGKYGIHAIVQENEWTIIFSNDTDAWGSFFYEKDNDVLRIKAKPEKAEFKEWMTIYFDNYSLNSANLNIHWGEIKVPITIEFDQHKVALDTYRKELSNLPGFNQAAWGAAARYCLNNNINLDEAMVWIDKALTMNGGNNFNNNSIKAGLLTLAGKKAEGDKLMEASIGNSTEAELNVYGYQLMNQNRLDDAIEIFKLNIKRHPDAWNVYDSLGEALNNKGDKKGAQENYETAYEKAPENQKARIEAIIKGL
jgi:tetratricopeptide (TPR) repeat protein